MNIQNANDFLVRSMAGLSQKEIDDLPIQDYEDLLEEINKLKNGEKSKGKN